MTLLWVALSIVFLILFLYYVPLYSMDLIEGEFVAAVETEEAFTASPMVAYYFKNFCRSCMEGKTRLGGCVWNCYTLVPKGVFVIGNSPKMNESVKLTAYFSVLGNMVICKWTSSNFKINPEKVKNIQEYIATKSFKKRHSYHG
jgi:F0F1-type ATP synthase membrane subunit a